MKILFVYSDKDNPNDNPFVKTLIIGLRDVGCDVDWGLDKFWHEYEAYDIIHFQWPETIFDWEKITDNDVEKLISHIKLLKQKNKKLIYTRHNITPHYCTEQNRIRIYDIVATNCDAIIHMGQYSINQFKNQYGNLDIKHFIVPHHTYENLYKNGIMMTKLEARHALNIPLNKFVILCFGDFRNDEERDLICKTFDSLNIENKYLLAPKFYPSIAIRRNLLKLGNSIFLHIAYRIKYHKYKVHFSNTKFISNNMLSYYFAAADIVFLQRCKILNSGNLPMGFYFGKVVVGPNIGNVGEILVETENPTFNPQDNDSVVDALEQGYNLCKNDFGKNNKKYAEEKFSTAICSMKIKHIYEQLKSI